MEGQLTATVHGTAVDFAEHQDLIHVLETKVGRLIFNGYPTGVEVGHAMQHGGPYPSTTDSRSTSVGTDAIDRFVRPICYPCRWSKFWVQPGVAVRKYWVCHPSCLSDTIGIDHSLCPLNSDHSQKRLRRASLLK